LIVANDILQACKNNDSKAQYALYRLCHAPLLRVGLRYSGGDRQAALANVNAAFLNILQNLDNYKPHIPFEAWIRRIMINVVIDEFRKEKKHQNHLEVEEVAESLENEATTNESQAELNLSAEDIQRLIGLLPELTAKIFNLFAFDDFTHREIAEKLGISESASKWHLVKARNLLKKHLPSYIDNSQIQFQNEKFG
jgi:RNA polymerase sigma factor (sigma-70 family)